MSLTNQGRDGALRCPRRLQGRIGLLKKGRQFPVFRPLNAGGDAAARRPYHGKRLHYSAIDCQRNNLS
jgi:hypothetical protein